MGLFGFYSFSYWYSSWLLSPGDRPKEWEIEWMTGLFDSLGLFTLYSQGYYFIPTHSIRHLFHLELSYVVSSLFIGLHCELLFNSWILCLRLTYHHSFLGYLVALIVVFDLLFGSIFPFTPIIFLGLFCSHCWRPGEDMVRELTGGLRSFTRLLFNVFTLYILWSSFTLWSYSSFHFISL